MGMNEFEAGVVGRIKESMKTRGLTQEESYRELSTETRKVADAYQFADPMVKEIIKRLLVIK